MKELLISRLVDDDKQTTGSMVLSDEDYTLSYFCTLELEYNNNLRNISCIPFGEYTCAVRDSEKYGRHLIVNNVPNRSLILLHYGNYNRNTKGCILVGESFKKIDEDNYFDITNSKNSMIKLMGFIEDGDIIKLTIQDAICKS